MVERKSWRSRKGVDGWFRSQNSQAQANLLKKCKNYEKKQIRVKIMENRVEKRAMIFGVPVYIPTEDIQKYSKAIE